MDGPKTIEDHAKDAGTPDWLFNSTKAYHGWAQGKEISRADFDSAVKQAEKASTASLKDDDGNDTTGRV